LEDNFGKLGESVGLIKVDEIKWEPLWDGMARKRHRLGYAGVIGSREKYLFSLGARAVGAIGFRSGARKLWA
jgi:hypothetical protein